MIIEFEVPGEPAGKQRARAGNGRHYTPEKTVKYENLVKMMALQQTGKQITFEGNVEVEVTAFYGIPASMSKGKRDLAKAGILKPTKKPDADNVGKIICDALNNIVYRDDAQVTDLSVLKRYSDRPRVCVRVILHD